MSVHKDSEEPRASRENDRGGDAAKVREMRGQGLVEYLIVLALLALAAVGAVAIFGDNVRTLFGIAPPRAAAPAGTSAPVSR